MKKLELRFALDGETLSNYYEDRADVSCIIGPLGSGKTNASLLKLLQLASEQGANDKGERPSRFIVIRGTYPELLSTTIRDFRELFGSFSHISMGHPPQAMMEFSLGDGTVVKADFIFLAADRDEDVKKIKGIQATHAWLNEASTIPKSIYDMLESRLGRYPSGPLGGIQCTHSSIQMDSNSCSDDEWLAEMFYNQAEMPGIVVYRQPPAAAFVEGRWKVLKGAENISNLPARYYDKLIRNRRHDWISVNVANEFGDSYDGKPVWPEYAAHMHTSDDIDFVPGYSIVVGVDFGLTPAVVLAQLIEGQLRVFDEIVEQRAAALQLGRKLVKKVNSEYPESAESLSGWGDPSGDSGSQADMNTPFLVLGSLNLAIVMAPTNDFILRREAVAERFSRLTDDGFPRILIGPKCPTLRKGCAGAYQYKRVQVMGKEGKYMDRPEKNRFSHVCEALQYLCVGLGDGFSIIGGDKFDDELYEAERKQEYSWLNPQ